MGEFYVQMVRYATTLRDPLVTTRRSTWHRYPAKPITLIVPFARGGAGPLTVSPSLFKERKFDPLERLDPIIRYASTPGILVVNPVE